MSVMVVTLTSTYVHSYKTRWIITTHLIWVMLQVVSESLEVISIGQWVGPWQSGKVILMREEERREEPQLLFGCYGYQSIDIELNHTTPLTIELYYSTHTCIVAV